MTDPTHPNPAWTPDQLYVYRERLAIMGEGRDTNTYAEYAVAYKQAENWSTANEQPR